MCIQILDWNVSIHSLLDSNGNTNHGCLRNSLEDSTMSFRKLGNCCSVRVCVCVHVCVYACVCSYLEQYIMSYICIYNLYIFFMYEEAYNYEEAVGFIRSVSAYMMVHVLVCLLKGLL